MPTGLCDDSSNGRRISWYKVKYQVNCGKAWWGTMGNAWALIYIKSKSMPDAAICHLVACSVLFSHHRIGVLAWSTCHLLPRLCRVWEDFYSATISVSLAVRRWIWFSKNRLSRSDWVKKMHSRCTCHAYVSNVFWHVWWSRLHGSGQRRCGIIVAGWLLCRRITYQFLCW